MQLTGIHHLSAITADARRNHDFYTRILGMRLVKKTVNQDDVSAYHLFYADGLASPGSDLTFFDYPSNPEIRGTRSIVRTSLRVAGRDTLQWWQRRLADLGVISGEVHERNGRATLDFEDFEGQRLRLVDDGGHGEAHPWAESPVPPEHQIRGLGPIALSVPDLAATHHVLTETLGMMPAQSGADFGQETTHIYTMGDGGPAAELHVVVEPGARRAIPGAGSVHHVAFRIPDSDYDKWFARLETSGVRSSGPVDRFYFRSLYFREPSGILFEIATDGPGFTADEPLASLGKRLALPPFLEARRAEIEANLTPLES